MPVYRKVGLWIASPLLAILIFHLAVLLYASSPSFPKGASIHGWEVEGISYASVIEQLETVSASFSGMRTEWNPDLTDSKPAKLTMQQLGIRITTDEINRVIHDLQTGSRYEQARKRFKASHSSFKLTLLIDDRAMKNMVEMVWPDWTTTQPLDAQRIITGEDEVTIIPEKPAYRLDEELMKELIQGWFDSNWVPQTDNKQGAIPSFTLPLTVMQPNVTSGQLADQHIDRKIGEFSTPLASNSEGRLHNVLSAASALSERILAPGETFDYGEIIEEAEQQSGFREAPVIVNGQLVTGLGGGICQVSSTLYNVVLRSGLEIVERKNHSLPVSYVPLGQDATFADGYINFKFRNSTGSHLLIKAFVQNDQLTVKLFGQTPQAVTYEIESTVLREIEPPVRYVYQPQLTEEQLVQEGLKGYKVETRRHKIENGVRTATELISTDTYSPQPRLVATPVEGKEIEESPSPPSIVEDGIERR